LAYPTNSAQKFVVKKIKKTEENFDKQEEDFLKEI